LLDAGDVGSLEELGEQPHELRLLLRRSVVPVAGERTTRHLVEVEEVGRDAADLRATDVAAWPIEVGGGQILLQHRDDARDRALHDVAWARRRLRHRARHHQPRRQCLAHGRRSRGESASGVPEPTGRPNGAISRHSRSGG